MSTAIARPAIGDPLAVPQELSGYEKWKALRSMPLPPYLAARCYVPPTMTAYLTNEESDKGPHQAKFFSVFFNNASMEVVAYLREAKFPLGSIIVKEKKLTAEGLPVELGAMLKHTDGKWEYLFLTSDNQVVRGDKANAACGACHSKASATDFVFGNYVNKPAHNQDAHLDGGPIK